MMETDDLFRELTDSNALDHFLEGFAGPRIWVGSSEVTDHYSMATSFFFAAEKLRSDLIKELGLDLFRREYPMLFLYRHALELYIKSVLPEPRRGHDLKELFAALARHLLSVYSIDISTGWLANAIEAFSSIDPYAEAFRYATTRSGDPAIRGNFSVNLEKLGEQMNKISRAFQHLHVALEGRGAPLLASDAEAK